MDWLKFAFHYLKDADNPGLLLRENVEEFFSRPALRSRPTERDATYLATTFLRLAGPTELVWWLDYGSLLGAYRWGRALPWDYDLDISYRAEGKAVLESLVGEFAAFGIELNLRRQRLLYEKVYLDIEAWLEQDGLMVREDLLSRQAELGAVDACYFRFPARWLQPLWEIRFEDHYFPCPNRPAELLTKRYGNFRIPIPASARTYLHPRFYRLAWQMSRYVPDLRAPE